MIDKLKFILFAIVVLSLLGFLGYWSVVTLQSGTDHALDQKVKELEKENNDLKTETQKQKDEISILESKLAEFAPVVEKETEVFVYKYQSLIDELQKLANNKVVLKLKSSGANVGTVQKFLNIYNNTSNKVDNDYGAGTVKAVTAFEKAEGLNANGEANVDTFNKMIDWLKKQA